MDNKGDDVATDPQSVRALRRRSHTPVSVVRDGRYDFHRVHVRAPHVSRRRAFQAPRRGERILRQRQRVEHPSGFRQRCGPKRRAGDQHGGVKGEEVTRSGYAQGYARKGRNASRRGVQLPGFEGTYTGRNQHGISRQRHRFVGRESNDASRGTRFTPVFGSATFHVAYFFAFNDTHDVPNTYTRRTQRRVGPKRRHRASMRRRPCPAKT